MEPAWTPDGAALLYVTEDEGSNDIRVVPVPSASGERAGGVEPIELTVDTERHEMSPSVSPDGTRFAFVQFDAVLAERDSRSRDEIPVRPGHDATEQFVKIVTANRDNPHTPGLQDFCEMTLMSSRATGYIRVDW